MGEQLEKPSFREARSVIPQSLQSEVRQISYERQFPMEKKERLARNQSK